MDFHSNKCSWLIFFFFFLLKKNKYFLVYLKSWKLLWCLLSYDSIRVWFHYIFFIDDLITFVLVKDKSEILIQIEELTNVKDELSAEVCMNVENIYFKLSTFHFMFISILGRNCDRNSTLRFILSSFNKEVLF